MKVIIGLGNLGAKYSNTRHNVGWLFLDFLQKKFSGSEWQKREKLKSEISEIVVNGEKVLLVKPQTFMNLSGEAVVSVMGFYKLENTDFLVVYDDIDLNFKEVRFREGGSGGTHNGMRDIIQKLGASDFARIRLGIEDRPIEIRAKWDLADYVLSAFSNAELASLSDVFTIADAKFSEWVAK